MTVQVTDLQAIGHGIQRPQHLLVTAGGRRYASDKSSAVADILRNHNVGRIGNAGAGPPPRHDATRPLASNPEI